MIKFVLKLFVLFCCVTVTTCYIVKIGMILPGPSSNRELTRQIGFGTSAGAVTIALERIRKEQLLPGAEFE